MKRFAFITVEDKQKFPIDYNVIKYFMLLYRQQNIKSSNCIKIV